MTDHVLQVRIQGDHFLSLPSLVASFSALFSRLMIARICIRCRRASRRTFPLARTSAVHHRSSGRSNRRPSLTRGLPWPWSMATRTRSSQQLVSILNRGAQPCNCTPTTVGIPPNFRQSSTTVRSLLSGSFLGQICAGAVFWTDPDKAPAFAENPEVRFRPLFLKAFLVTFASPFRISFAVHVSSSR